MKITTSILISLIQKHSQIKVSSESSNPGISDLSELYISHESDLEIRGVRLADGTADAHILYVCSDIDQFLPDADHSAFVLVSKSSQDLPASSTDLFELVTADEPLTVLYFLYSLMLRLQKWDQELKENTLSSYHFYQLFSVGREVYPYPFCLIDHEFKIIGMTQDMYPLSPSGERPQNDRISDSRASELLNDPEFQKTSSATDIYTYPSHQEHVIRLCLNITQNGNYLGRILSDVREDTPGIRALFRHLAGYLQSAFLSYADDVMLSRGNDALHKLIADLLTGRRDRSGDIPLILGRYHWDEHALYRVCVISLSDQQSIRMIRPYLSHLLEQKFDTSCAVSEGETIVLVSDAGKNEQTYRKKLLTVTATWPLAIGVSSPVTIPNLKNGHRQAVFALPRETKDRKTSCVFFSTCHTEYIMDVLKHEMPDEDFCHPGLRKLLLKDEEENTDDVRLVWELICSGFNVSKAAENCFVHRSTFIRRLHSISQITGIDFQNPLDPETLLDLLISFRLLHYTGQ